MAEALPGRYRRSGRPGACARRVLWFIDARVDEQRVHMRECASRGSDSVAFIIDSRRCPPRPCTSMRAVGYAIPTMPRWESSG